LNPPKYVLLYIYLVNKITIKTFFSVDFLKRSIRRRGKYTETITAIRKSTEKYPRIN